MTLHQSQFQTARGPLPYLFAPSWRGAAAPLVVFLHGAKDRGHDLSQLLAWGFPKFVAAQNELGYHWLALQIPSEAKWPDYQAELFDLIESLKPIHGADRFLLSGFSLGSAGAWEIGVRHAHRLTGLVIVSGRLPETLSLAGLRALDKTPVWIFHGEKDDKVPVSGAVAAFEALRELGGPARLTLISTGDHFIADEVYSRPALQEWLLAADKSQGIESVIR